MKPTIERDPHPGNCWRCNDVAPFLGKSYYRLVWWDMPLCQFHAEEFAQENGLTLPEPPGAPQAGQAGAGAILALLAALGLAWAVWRITPPPLPPDCGRDPYCRAEQRGQKIPNCEGPCTGNDRTNPPIVMGHVER